MNKERSLLLFLSFSLISFTSSLLLKSNSAPTLAQRHSPKGTSSLYKADAGGTKLHRSLRALISEPKLALRSEVAIGLALSAFASKCRQKSLGFCERRLRSRRPAAVRFFRTLINSRALGGKEQLSEAEIQAKKRLFLNYLKKKGDKINFGQDIVFEKVFSFAKQYLHDSKKVDGELMDTLKPVFKSFIKIKDYIDKKEGDGKAKGKKGKKEE